MYISVCLFCTILRPQKATPQILDWVRPRVTPFILLPYSPSTSDLYHVAKMTCCWWRLSCNYHCQYSCEQNSMRVREMYCAIVISSYPSSTTLHTAVIGTAQSPVGSGRHDQAMLHLFQKHLHITCYSPTCWASNYLSVYFILQWWLIFLLQLLWSIVHHCHWCRW